jgi:hypothetical protein
MTNQADDQYSPEETAQRMALAIKRSFTMSHVAQKPTKKKLGRPRKRKLKPRR